jgi:hypothetical protein
MPFEFPQNLVDQSRCASSVWGDLPDKSFYPWNTLKPKMLHGFSTAEPKRERKRKIVGVERTEIYRTGGVGGVLTPAPTRRTDRKRGTVKSSGPLAFWNFPPGRTRTEVKLINLRGVTGMKLIERNHRR